MYLQKPFTNSSKSPLQAYDAMHDKFASFYFNGYGMKKHLKKLRKVIEFQPHTKEYKQYAQTLNKKLAQLQGQEQYVRSKIKPYQQTLKAASLNKLRKVQNFFQDGKMKNNNYEYQQEKKQSKALPKITKSNKTITRNTQLNLEINSYAADIDEKKDSTNQIDVERLKRRIDKQYKIKIVREKSMQMFKVNKSNTFGEESPLKQIKRQDFIRFLKEKQESLLANGFNKNDIT